MSTALLHGLVKPASPDTGESFFPQLEANIQYQSDILSKTSTVAAASWGSDLGGGTYRQTITIPTALTESPKSYIFDDLQMKVRDANGEVCHPRIDRQSDTTYHIYTNDNTVEYTVTYGT